MSNERIFTMGREDVARVLVLEEVVDVVRDAYIAMANGSARLFPLVREPVGAAMFGLRSAVWEDRELLGLKVSGYFPENAAEGRDNHQATIVLVSPRTGRPSAFIDGNHVTWIRTAAAGALGTSLLARADARRVLVVGNGLQAEAQAVGHAEVLADRTPEILVHAPRDADGSKATAFVERLAARGLAVRAAPDVERALSEADVVVTATLAREPIVRSEWIASGTHITAIGSDAPGKRELDPRLVDRARLVVDSADQSRRFGESQDLADVAAVEIGAILTGRATGRTSAEEITIFDSTGIGLHDLVTAELARRKGVELGAGAWLSLA